MGIGEWEEKGPLKGTRPKKTLVAAPVFKEGIGVGVGEFKARRHSGFPSAPNDPPV